ncbi:MAG: DUF1501 domain-containing protein [Verrucomicrobiae bacterium]|nr:DUF1501 domain-containing protein [Verrucomicrobiae bacterium]
MAGVSLSLGKLNGFAQKSLNRRDFLEKSGTGLGLIALAPLLRGAESKRSGGLTHHPARAKRVIHLFMHGGPSHMDLWDPKPELSRRAGQPLPESFGEVMTRRQVANNPLLAPVRPFSRHGQSGLEISDFLPEMSKLADHFCVLRSCHGDSVNHPQSVYQMNTGSILMGRPSVGAWVSYGLGSENESLPAYVVLPDPRGGSKGGPPAWGSGFLPAAHQGVTMRPGSTPLLNLKPPPERESRQRATLDLIQDLNRSHLEARDFDDELSARIASYEMAFRMQTEAPELVDLASESEATKKLYGMDDPVTREFGTRCLLARRMIERGVRFVQLYSGDTNGWDAHKDVLQNHGEYCAATDRPVAGLLRDLESRGLLEDTLVIWGGEFGRMPMSEQGTGRDHNPWGYSIVLAGGGVKGGHVHGATDEFGLRATESPVHIHDLHATILHLLGFDHERLTFPHNGLDARLTGVSGKVVHNILA